MTVRAPVEQTPKVRANPSRETTRDSKKRSTQQKPQRSSWKMRSRERRCVSPADQTLHDDLEATTPCEGHESDCSIEQKRQQTMSMMACLSYLLKGALRGRWCLSHRGHRRERRHGISMNFLLCTATCSEMKALCPMWRAFNDWHTILQRT